ncbi:putative DNA binding domain-containing protein [Microcoleus sp. S28C3]|uniref:RNA-binding domain-containing protein n=1 Tax=Microcoleus sp. S28C3 TaxID=3055414 RepID=UPI002FD6343F
MTQPINFVQGETFHQEEGDSFEFKEITSKRPVNTILNHAEEYVLGFLNAQIEGYLYLGIDDSGIIQGVTLNRNDRDEISRSIPDKLRRTDPAIPHHYYDVNIHDVFNWERKRIEDLCIVQIHVVKTEDKKALGLYRTSGGSVYLKKGSTCMKLNSEEIAKEIERRTQVYLRKKADALDRRLEKEPNNRDLLSKRAEVATDMGDVDNMARFFRKLLELDPKSPKRRIECATAYQSIGDLEGALSILNEALKSNINDFSILNNKGLMLQELDRWDEALLFYQNLLKMKPDDYTIITQIGVILRHKCQYSESIKFLNYALSKNPNYRLAKYEKKKTYQAFKRGNTN